jgi:succinyl-diaminopimelate desuccinylase
MPEWGSIDQSAVLGLLQSLVSIESHADVPDREREIGRYLVEWFRQHDIDADLLPVTEERANVVARLPGGDGPSLMLNGHLDTVPAGSMENAFDLSVRDGTVWGRGACDMKGAVAAMVCAMTVMARDEHTARTGDLLFTGTVGEETGSIGVKALMEAGVRTTYAVVGEPTSLRVGIAHKGACFVRIGLDGRGAHGSTPDEGVNAISYASRIIRVLEGELRSRLVQRSHPLLGSSTVSVGRICGGTQPNIVAERCTLDIDRRTLPNERGGTLDEIEELVEDVCGGVEDLSWHVEELPETSVVPHRALGTDPDSTLANEARRACRDLDLNGEPVGVPYWTDGGHLAASGIETIILGPGDIAFAHGPHEHVAASELEAAANLYLVLAQRMLSSS